MLRLKLPGLELLPDQRVLKASDYAAVLTAQETVAAGKAEAERIRAEAVAAYESEKLRGYEDGLAEGKMQIAMQMVDTINNMVNFLGSMEGRMVDLVMKALRRILGEMDQKELVVRVVRHALEVARTQQTVVLRAHPDEAAVLQARIKEILTAHPSIRFVDVQSDARLEMGGCILETDIGIVDASLEVQLAAIEGALRRSVQGGAAGS